MSKTFTDWSDDDAPYEGELDEFDNDPDFVFSFADGRKRSFLGNDGCYQIDAAKGCE